MPARLDKGSKSQHGFTLMEMVIGIVVFSIVLLLVVTLIAPQARRGIDPIWQVRAAELGQSLITEISAKAFDQHSDMAGGLLRCNEVTATPCTPAAFLGMKQVKAVLILMMWMTITVWIKGMEIF